MPAKSVAQQEMMGADLARLRHGEKTETGMTEAQLKEFAATKHHGLPHHKKPEKRGMHMDEKHHGGRMKHPRGG